MLGSLAVTIAHVKGFASEVYVSLLHIWGQGIGNCVGVSVLCFDIKLNDVLEGRGTGVPRQSLESQGKKFWFLSQPATVP